MVVDAADSSHSANGLLLDCGCPRANRNADVDRYTLTNPDRLSDQDRHRDHYRHRVAQCYDYPIGDGKCDAYCDPQYHRNCDGYGDPKRDAYRDRQLPREL